MGYAKDRRRGVKEKRFCGLWRTEDKQGNVRYLLDDATIEKAKRKGESRRFAENE